LKKFFSILLFLTILSSCKQDPQPNIYTIQGIALGTTYKVIYISENPEPNVKKSIDSIFNVINQSLSTYIESSDISKINQGIESVKVDEHFVNVFNKSKEIWNLTDGFFDPTIGIITKAYGLGPIDDNIQKINIDSLLSFTGFEKVSLINNLIVKEKKEIFLDFNAIAKGYCVDIISKLFKDKKINNHLVEIGGEMVASGKNLVSNEFWRVGITNPVNPNSKNFFKKILLNNSALASSGNYRKFIIDEFSGEKIVHTINPKNGKAYETNVLGSSVIAKDCITADAYATAFMAMPLQNSIDLISKIEEIEVMIIYLNENKDVDVFLSKNFDKINLN